MSISKKALALVLSLLMVFSVLTVAAPADSLLTASALENVSLTAAADIVDTDVTGSAKQSQNAARPLPALSAEAVYADYETLTADGFRYVVIDGEAVIIGSELSVEGVLEIPAKLDGIAVTAIGDYAFAGCKGITEVKLPRSVVAIGNGSFRGCESLGRINLDTEKVSIGKNAFTGCADEVIVDESLFGRVEVIGTGKALGGAKPVAGQNAQTASGDWYTKFPAAMMKSLRNALIYHYDEDKGYNQKALVDISAYKIPSSQLGDIIAALEIEYPVEFNALEYGSYGYYRDGATGIIEAIYLKGGYEGGYDSGDVTEAKTTARRNELQAVADAFAEACEGKNDYEKVLLAHEMVILSGDYDWNYEKYGAYDILITGSSVCQGYTDAMKMLLNYVDVPVLAAESDPMNHTWNIVRLGNKWYHIDATWNDYESLDYVYTYYLLSDSEISLDYGSGAHEGWEAAFKCTSTAFSNFPRTYNTNAAYENDVWYIAEIESTEIYSCDIYGNRIKTVVTGVDALPGVGVCNNILYYCVGDEIRFKGLDSGATGVLYTLSDAEQAADAEYLSLYCFKDGLFDGGYIFYMYEYYDKTDKTWYMTLGENAFDVSDGHDYNLSAPTLEAHSVGYTSAKLTWTNADESAHGHSVYRCDRAGQPYNFITDVDNSKNTYTNTALSTGTTYYYKVRAYAELVNGEKVYSDYSNYHTARPLPATPVVSTLRTSNTSAAISWVKIYGATGYSVYRSDSQNGEYKWVGGFSTGDATAFNDKTVKAGQTYYYKVRAYRQMGSDMMMSEYSKPAILYTKTITPTITARSVGYTSAKVEWQPIAGVTGYSIYRCDVGGGTYSYIASVGKDVTTYTNTGLSTGTTYYFKVRGVVDGGSAKYYTPYSAAATARPLPATPVVTVKSSNAGAVTLSWVKIYGATGYSIARSDSLNGTYTWIGSNNSGDTITYTDKTAKAGKTYYYKVRAFRKMGSDNMMGEYCKPVTVSVK